MKIRVLLFALLGSSLVSPAIRAADQQPEAPQGPGGHRKEKQTELGSHMEKIGHAFRSLGRQIHDPAKNEDSLKLVAIIRTNAQATVDLKPAKIADVPSDEQAQFVANYQKSMKGFLADVDKLEAALKAGNNDQAAELVKTLKKDMDNGHKQFRKKRKDDMM